MYAIPLDSARQDAAPRGHSGARVGGAGRGSGSSGGGSGSGSGSGAASSGGSGTTGSGASGSGSGTSYTSGAHGSTGPSGKSGQPPVLVPGGQPGSLIHSSNGFGSSPDVPGVSASASAGLASVDTDSGSAPLIAILLATVVLAIGAYVGAAAWRTYGSRTPKRAA